MAATPSPFFLLPILSLILSSSASPTTISSDQSTLLTLKNHLLSSNPDTVLAGNWSSAASVCRWAGVTCGSRHRRVTALDLTSMGLVGPIPPQLGNLSFLVNLSLGSNGFTGNLPDELSGLRSLRLIDVSNNSLSGSIPASLFSNMSKLETLVVSANRLRGNIPPEIGNLSNLELFVASSNMFAGAIPSWIGNMRKLTFLNLQYNGFEGTIPEEVSKLHELQDLRLGNNALSGSIPSGIFNISTLRNLYLENNNLSGTLPSSMGHNLPKLEQIFLNFNALTGKIPDSISNSSLLDHISLDDNQFTGPIPLSIANLRLLDCLHLFNNRLANEIPNQELTFFTSLTRLPVLTDVSVSGNPLNGFLPPSIGNLSSVKRFYASNCGISGGIPNEIANLSRLVNLQLSGNDLSVPDSFRGLRSLQGLFLRRSNLRGSFPISICELPALYSLRLGQNQISGTIPDCLGNATTLGEIDLNSNRLTSIIPSSLWNLRDLTQLDLSSNLLSGDLPQQVQNLKAAISIDLSRNRFTGVIPSGYGGMQNLINFSLASNELQGSIPESFGEMISLEMLDLSDNDLSGEIPKSLEGLRSLKYFNVSFNRLRGEIPRGGPFENFTSQLFASNEALCGDRRLDVPRCSNSSRRELIIVVVSVILATLILSSLMIILIMWKRRKEAAAAAAPPQEADALSMSERFSYKQIQLATDGFSHANLLGSGSFGSVYRARFEEGVDFAVKVFNLEVELASKSFGTECEMLSNLRHRNLTKVISACSNLEFKALILEYMENGNLENWLYGNDHGLDLMQRLEIMIDVACAMEYLHHGYMKPVVHCDLKPSNILLDRDMVAHVTDFGITKLLGQEDSIVHTQTLATLGYMAPEYGSEGLVSSASDVYSYGILLMETFTGRRPGDDMFGGEVSLRSWIGTALPGSGFRVVDPNLVSEEDEHSTEKMQCVLSIMALAMDCTAEKPRDRMNMMNVLAALNKIRLSFSVHNKI